MSSGSANQRSPPPYFTPVARSLPPSYRSALSETESVRTAQEQIYQWSTSIPSGAPTESDTGSTAEIDTVVGSSDGIEPVKERPKVYAYYNLFTRDGATPSKHPVDRQDPYLGRVEAWRITPPHTAETMIRHICDIEEDSRYHSSQLFLSAYSASPMDRNEHVPILTGPGSNPQQPLALVLLDESDAYSKTIIAYGYYGKFDSNWLSFKKGEVLFTDEVKREETYDGRRYDAYYARNSKGEYGFVPLVACLKPK